MNKRIDSAGVSVEKENVGTGNGSAAGEKLNGNGNGAAASKGLCISEHVSASGSEQAGAADYDFFGDPENVERFRSKLVESRMRDLHISREEAEAWTDKTIEKQLTVSEGKFQNKFERPVPTEFTIEASPLTPEEAEYWNQRIEFRVETLGLSLEDAQAWTKNDIERGRFLTSSTWNSQNNVQAYGFEEESCEAAAS